VQQIAAPAMPRRRVSSSLTGFYKFILPAIWAFAGGGTAVALLQEVISGSGLPKGSDSFLVLFFGFWLIGLMILYFGCAHLKQVSIGDGVLYISNFVKEIRVPFVAIQEVTESRLDNMHPVTIRFRVATPFGRKVVFIPHLRLLLWGKYPVVAELRALARVPS
jgi:hypothetical protein